MLASIVAGAITGIAETLMLFPIENIKQQQQLPSSPRTSVSFLYAARRTWRMQGALGFYRGMAPVLFCAVPNQALRWASFDFFCGLTHCLAPGASLWAVALAGMGSGILVSIITGVPVETAKTQAIHASMVSMGASAIVPHTTSGDVGEDSDIDVLEGTTIPYVGSPAATYGGVAGAGAAGGGGGMIETCVVNVNTSLVSPRKSHRKSSSPAVAAGAAAEQQPVLRGWLPTVLKKISNQGVRFPVHRFILNWLCGDTSVTCDASSNPFFGFLAGATAGICSIPVNNAVDVIKARMQSLDADHYGHSLACAKKLLREEGVQVFFHGMGARALRSGLGAGFAFAFFPVIKSYILATD